MSSAYGFTEDSARRIARVVKAVEGDTTTPTRIGPMLGGSTMSVVKVTALGSPLCTGQRVDYHASANTIDRWGITESNKSGVICINYRAKLQASCCVINLDHSALISCV